jgi:hypothetical protein
VISAPAVLFHHGWTTFDTMLVVLSSLVALALYIGRKTRRLEQVLTNRIGHLDELLNRVESEWRFQHRQGTYVGTIEGLWRVLEIGLEKSDGLNPELRAAIYRAGDEMFSAFHAETRGDPSAHRLRLWEDDQPAPRREEP